MMDRVATTSSLSAARMTILSASSGNSHLQRPRSEGGIWRMTGGGRAAIDAADLQSRESEHTRGALRSIGGRTPSRFALVRRGRATPRGSLARAATDRSLSRGSCKAARRAT
jgi:hypothetical protein